MLTHFQLLKLHHQGHKAPVHLSSDSFYLIHILLTYVISLSLGLQSDIRVHTLNSSKSDLSHSVRSMSCMSPPGSNNPSLVFIELLEYYTAYTRSCFDSLPHPPTPYPGCRASLTYLGKEALSLSRYSPRAFWILPRRSASLSKDLCTPGMLTTSRTNGAFVTFFIRAKNSVLML